MSAVEPDAALNGDLGARVCVDTAAMPWTRSPSGTVWRKRMHRVGPSESGQVTSVVRYQPGATFPRHVHPDGEEILVLDGTFSDEHGHWPAGTYLLNPEGFSHAPFSEAGCTLLVKLRQYPGADRGHVVVDTRAAAWSASGAEGIAIRPLYEHPAFLDAMRLERWAAGTAPGPVVHAAGAEIFILEGEFEDEHGSYRAGTLLRLPPGARHQPRSGAGCELYVKRGGFAYMRAG